MAYATWQTRDVNNSTTLSAEGLGETRVSDARPREWREWLPQARALVDEWVDIQVARDLPDSATADLTQRIARALHRAFQKGEALPPL